MIGKEPMNFYDSSKEVTLNNIRIANNVPVIKDKTDILYEQVEQIDLDIDYDFQIRTDGYNQLVELANPILAVALRTKKISHLDDIAGLYTRMQNEIIAVAEKVKMLHYDSAFQLSFRYCLCTFIDEMVMATPWGSTSIWAERSLLSYFHNETWGGEKFYSILSRIMLEPEKYQELLEFMYICLALGFKGQYALKPHGQENIQNILIKLQKTLRAIRGHNYIKGNPVNIYERDYTMKNRIPTKYFFLGSGLILIFIYIIYQFYLDSYSSEIIKNINNILQ